MRLDDYDPGDDIRALGRGGGGFAGGGAGGLGGLLIGFLPMLLGRKMGCGTLLILGVAVFFMLGPGPHLHSMRSDTSDPLADSHRVATVACAHEGAAFASTAFPLPTQVGG